MSRRLSCIGSGRKNLEEKLPRCAPCLSAPGQPPPAASPARLLGTGSPNCPGTTAVSCPANSDLLPVGIAEKQGLAAAQTVRSAVSPSSG